MIIYMNGWKQTDSQTDEIWRKLKNYQFLPLETSASTALPEEYANKSSHPETSRRHQRCTRWQLC